MKTEFEKACKKLGIDPKKLPSVAMWPEEYRKSERANYLLTIIYKAEPAAKKSHWSKINEWKYWPAFWLKEDKERASGFGFSGSGYDYTGTYAYLGSRFAFKKSDDAIAFGKRNEDLFNDLILTPKTK